MYLAIDRPDMDEVLEGGAKDGAPTDKISMAGASITGAPENLFKLLKQNLDEVEEVGERLALPKWNLVAIIRFEK